MNSPSASHQSSSAPSVAADGRPYLNVAGHKVKGVPYVPEFFTPFHAYMEQLRGCVDCPLVYKWEPYFHAYEIHFARFRGKTVTMMEVGVQSGGSMDMWRAYFCPGLRCYGVDINPPTKQFESEFGVGHRVCRRPRGSQVLGDSHEKVAVET